MKRFIKKLLSKDLLNKIRNKLYIKIGLFVLTEINQSFDSRTIDSYYKIEKVSSQHIDALKKYSKEYRNQDHFEKNIIPRLNNKDRYTGFAVIDSETNEIAYLSWIDFKHIEIKEVSFNKKLLNTEAYFLDDDCVPQHRRKGIHNKIFTERLKYCANKGIKTIYIVIYLNNFRALQNLKKFNFKLYKTMMYYSFLKLIKRH